jgi:hypothetical protein
MTGSLAPCPSCHDVTPPPPNEQATIDAARAASIDFPFLEAQTRAVANASSAYQPAVAGFVYRWSIPAVLVAIPAVVSWRYIGVPSSDPKQIEEFVYQCLLHVSLVGCVVLALLVWRSERADAAAIRATLEGRPVDVVELTCRSCGGPIESRTLDDVVVRCPHCRTQNVMDRATAAASARRELASFRARADWATRSSRITEWRAFLIVVPPLFTLLVLVVLFVRCWDGRL